MLPTASPAGPTGINTGMSERWNRLQASLQQAGIETKVIVRSGINGMSHQIQIRSGKHIIHVNDMWWRKNRDVWVGWNVWIENADAIVVKDYRWTKKRSEVVGYVQDALRRT